MICPKCGYEHNTDVSCPAPLRVAEWVQLALLLLVGLIILATLLLNTPGLNPVPAGSVKFRPIPRDVQQVHDDNSNCMDNQRRIITAILIYAQDHEGKIPTSDIVWKNLKIAPALLNCPKAPRLSNGYGLNQTIAGQSMYDIQDKPHALVIADCGTGSGMLTSMNDVDTRRHDNGYIAAFADSHVELLPEGAGASLTIMLRLPTGSISSVTSAAPTAPDPARGPREEAMKLALATLRTAVKQFQADTGVFPATLDDLLASGADKLTASLSGDAHARYRGPYLTGGTLPLNPLADDPSRNWSYDSATGMVKLPMNGVTVDGINYADL